MNIDNTRKAVRQGDVLVVPVTDITRRTKVAQGGTFILAEGESTGHSHHIMHERAVMFRDESNAPILHVPEPQVDEFPVVLEHQEHKPILLAPGDHMVVRQRTYQMSMVRRVAD